MVIYFSGTGNSKYVAEAIADQLGDEITCATKNMKDGVPGKYKSDTPWVFVFPVYVSNMAKVFAEYINRSEFSGAKEAYFVTTCASEMGATPNTCAKFCKEKSLTYMGTKKVVMPQNYIALFKMTEADEIERRIKAVAEIVPGICDLIKKKEVFDGKLTSKFEHAGTILVEKLYYGPFTKTKKFYATDACVGCGICKNQCPCNNIEMEQGKPKWIKSCVHCMACINQCPKQAIEYGKGTIGKTRYTCKKYEKTN